MDKVERDRVGGEGAGEGDGEGEGDGVVEAEARRAVVDALRGDGLVGALYSSASWLARKDWKDERESAEREGSRSRALGTDHRRKMD